MPRSTRPVATVPRPVMENTSSTGIRNGLSVVALRGRDVARRQRPSARRCTCTPARLRIVSPFWRTPAPSARSRWMIGMSSPGKSYSLSSSRISISTSSSSSSVVHLVGLVHEHDDVGHADLTGQQDVLAGLRHRAVRSGHNQDRAVHLRSAGDHVLDIVGVAGAVNVSIVTLLGLDTRRERC